MLARTHTRNKSHTTSATSVGITSTKLFDPSRTAPPTSVEITSIERFIAKHVWVGRARKGEISCRRSPHTRRDEQQDQKHVTHEYPFHGSLFFFRIRTDNFDDWRDADAIVLEIVERLVDARLISPARILAVQGVDNFDR